jgi:hypothetical protein
MITRGTISQMQPICWSAWSREILSIQKHFQRFYIACCLNLPKYKDIICCNRRGECWTRNASSPWHAQKTTGSNHWEFHKIRWEPPARAYEAWVPRFLLVEGSLVKLIALICFAWACLFSAALWQIMSISSHLKYSNQCGGCKDFKTKIKELMT